jgi:tetratricopeptide (TPR) repeat protein
VNPHDQGTPRHTPAHQAFTLAERLQELRDALDHACLAHTHQPVTPDQRELLKQQIIALFREADAALQQAQAMKDAVKGLAEQWKHLDGRGVGTIPGVGATVHRPTPVASTTVSSTTGRVDHLGASTFIEKGWSKLALLDAVGAEAAFRRALDLAPGSLEAQTLLAWAQMQQEHYDAALQTLQVVLQHDPHNALAHTNLGYISLRRKAYGDAIEHLSTVIRADADRRAVLYAHLYLGMVYREREMYDDADAFFSRALELGPNLLQAWYELGRARWFAGRPDDARQAWKTGSEANKFSPWGKRCADMLQVVEQGGAPSREG